MATPDLDFEPSENPFVVQHGGFYRRWFSMIDDVDELKGVVAQLRGSTQDLWVPVFRAAGRAHEERGDLLEAAVVVGRMHEAAIETTVMPRTCSRR